MTDSSPDARENTHPDAQSRLAQAAAALFAEHGYDAISIDRIAAGVGASKGLFYHHYSAKADVLADIVLAVREAMLAAAAAALTGLDAEASAVRRLEALALGELNAAFEQPAAYRVAVHADAILADARISEKHAARRDRAIEARQDLERLYQDAYRAGVRAGQFAPLPPRFAVWLIRLPVLAAADWNAGPEGARTSADRVAEAVARFAARGLTEPNEPA